MKRTALLVLPVLALASLNACAPNGQSSMNASSAPRSGTPQPPNSLPEGATVNAPLTRPTGEVTTHTTTPPAATAGQRGSLYR